MKTFRFLISAAVIAVAASQAAAPADACTRVVYHGEKGMVAIGRSLDWKTPIPTNLWVYPRGMKKMSHNLPGAFSWTSKYGSVYAVGYDAGVTEGMNEVGLTVNSLFCKGTVYAAPDAKGAPMSLSVFPAWLLDLCGTTQEAVDLLRSTDFVISGSTFDKGTTATLHFGITDRSGKTAIVEFENGVMHIYDDVSVPVLTNDPVWPSMNAINDYWKKVGGEHMLPGTVKSPDRFVRADFFDHNVTRTADPDLAVTITRSIVMNCSVPYLYTVESEPNVSSTQWRSIALPTKLRYYYDVVTRLGVVYVDLEKLNLNPGAPVLKLDMETLPDMAGCANHHLKRVKPFDPAY